ncbi:uncharacterized protein LOC118022629 isoform X2 [Mirounga leonina]|uniref:uncharacterized protein LOC118022629 isoform X2 n=1 Tax=Mirounga leonina TaxID=9715 RepID=UPI00156BE598|nr:uncharacterized protein LOC118022629 isoform X2 [Mirounga leonina]
MAAEAAQDNSGERQIANIQPRSSWEERFSAHVLSNCQASLPHYLKLDILIPAALLDYHLLFAHGSLAIRASLVYRSPKSHKYGRRLCRGLCSDDNIQHGIAFTTGLLSLTAGTDWMPCTHSANTRSLWPSKCFIRNKR